MVRVALLVLVLSLLCRWALGKWPWDYLRGPPSRGRTLAEARKLLAVPIGASRNDIIEAHKRLVARVHPDRGGTTTQVHEANVARDLLLEELPPEGADNP